MPTKLPTVKATTARGNEPCALATNAPPSTDTLSPGNGGKTYSTRAASPSATYSAGPVKSSSAGIGYRRYPFSRSSSSMACRALAVRCWFA